MLKKLLFCLLPCAALVPQAAVQAQAWPTKPVRVISAYAAGGTNELAARPITAHLSIVFGQQFLLEAKPGKLAYASAGNGSINHLSGELLSMQTKTNLLHVPYKGGGPALTGVVKSAGIKLD